MSRSTARISLGSQDYLSIKGSTNTWSVVMPYEVAFQGFSSELASVLDGLARLPYCFIVTNLVVEPAATRRFGHRGTAQRRHLRRYGRLGAVAADQCRPCETATAAMGGRYGGRNPRHDAQAACCPCRPPRVAPRTIDLLDEKPLRFTLSVQAIKLKPHK